MFLHLDPTVEALVAAAADVVLSCGGHIPGKALRVCLPGSVGCPPALHRRCAPFADAAHAFRQCGAGCLGSDLVCGDGLVVVADDGACQTAGVLSGAAGHDMRAGQPVAAILCFGGPFVDVDVVSFAAIAT